jgi:soluble lytic murein transglycosylase-like protein
MVRHEEARKTLSFTDRRPPTPVDDAWEPHEPRTIVIQHGSGWQSLAVLFLCLLLAAAVLLGHWVVRGLDRKNQEATAAMARAERKIQQLESGFAFEAQRRQLLLGMRNHILKANPRVSLAEAYRYAELALAASEKYPAVDPLFLLAIGLVESGYDPPARSRADARGLYQIWPSTGRLLAHALGWSYDDSLLYDPEKNTQAAALYLDVLFATYKDPGMVLAEYNGGPLNAGYLRAGAAALASETRSYVPRVLELHQRLQQEFEEGTALRADARDDSVRRGKTLGQP